VNFNSDPPLADVNNMYHEEDPTDPVNTYGASKLEGERLGSWVVHMGSDSLDKERTNHLFATLVARCMAMA